MTKKYKITFDVKVIEQTEAWNNPAPDISFKVEENIPVGVDPAKYLASRLNEEFKRNSANVEFDWKTEEQENEIPEIGQ